MEITIKTQAEFNKLPKKFDEFTYIYIQGKNIEITFNPQNSQVTAWGNSQVTARENSQVTARENSQVTARENSQVTARENSQVTAWGNSQVTARGNSQVTAWGNSQVTARENSQVTAYNQCSVRVESDYVTTILFGFALAILFLAKKAKVEKKSETAQIVIINAPEPKWTIQEYLEKYDVKENNNTVILFKKVSKDFKTQENTRNETLWKIGSTLDHPNWKPESAECGEGKFHACSYPYFCDDFRNYAEDRYIAIKINVDDLYSWKNPQYKTKIAFKKAKVLYECDKYGKKI